MVMSGSRLCLAQGHCLWVPLEVGGAHEPERSLMAWVFKARAAPGKARLRSARCAPRRPGPRRSAVGACKWVSVPGLGRAEPGCSAQAACQDPQKVECLRVAEGVVQQSPSYPAMGIHLRPWLLVCSLRRGVRRRPCASRARKVGVRRGIKAFGGRRGRQSPRCAKQIRAGECAPPPLLRPSRPKQACSAIRGQWCG